MSEIYINKDLFSLYLNQIGVAKTNLENNFITTLVSKGENSSEAIDEFTTIFYELRELLKEYKIAFDDAYEAIEKAGERLNNTDKSLSGGILDKIN